MAHDFAFLVRVSMEREQGQFATRDEMAAAIQEALEGADIGNFTGDNGGEYNTTSWEVEEYEEPKPAKPTKPQKQLTGRDLSTNRFICDKCKQPKPLAEARPLGARGSTVWHCAACRAERNPVEAWQARCRGCSYVGSILGSEQEALVDADEHAISIGRTGDQVTHACEIARVSM